MIKLNKDDLAVPGLRIWWFKDVVLTRGHRSMALYWEGDELAIVGCRQLIWPESFPKLYVPQIRRLESFRAVWHGDLQKYIVRENISVPNLSVISKVDLRLAVRVRLTKIEGPKSMSGYRRHIATDPRDPMKRWAFSSRATKMLETYPGYRNYRYFISILEETDKPVLLGFYKKNQKALRVVANAEIVR